MGPVGLFLSTVASEGEVKANPAALVAVSLVVDASYSWGRIEYVPHLLFYIFSIILAEW